MDDKKEILEYIEQHKVLEAIEPDRVIVSIDYTKGTAEEAKEIRETVSKLMCQQNKRRPDGTRMQVGIKLTLVKRRRNVTLELEEEL